MDDVRDTRATPDLFAGLARPTGSARLTMEDSLELTVASLNAHGPDHRHWAVAWSGGKDSTATLTLLLHLLETGRVQRPETLTVLYADTRQELPPLAVAAEQLMETVRRRWSWVRLEVARAPLDKRFLVYMLGRGVPPPNNSTFRWCTRQIKVDPMAASLERLLAEADGKILTITGVRQGESAIRDRRIEMSCSRNGAECGQGWYQQTLPNAPGVRGRIATLAPVLHWRVCHIWEWLRFFAPADEFGGFPTAMLAEAYGGEEAEEANARTGCVGCPLASKDLALENLVRRPDWAYLDPLLGLKPLYAELRRPARRLRKDENDRLDAGSLLPRPQRLGPLTFDARLWALDQVLSIQRKCNEAAVTAGRPGVDLLNGEEEARIRELIAAGTWPNGWSGDEPTGDAWLKSPRSRLATTA